MASDSLRLVRPMLEALKSGIPSEIAKYEDIRPIDMDEEIENIKPLLICRKKFESKRSYNCNKVRKGTIPFRRCDPATVIYGF